MRKNDRIAVTLVQPDLVWEDPEANLSMLGEMLDGCSQPADLVILPETFSTGFTMNAKAFAEGPDGRALNWMIGRAREKQCCMTGSVIVRDGGKIFNRLYWVTPEGLSGSYDKRHLFRMGREDQHFSPGMERKVFQWGSFRIMPQICYDLRFPVFARNRNDYDILFYVANWPAPRHEVWETLVRARAIENQSYVLGISRSGVDGEGVDHLGGTCVIDPKGNIVEMLGPEPAVIQTTISLGEIRRFREKFPVWKDADRFRLEE